jgi:hypothetical protein
LAEPDPADNNSLATGGTLRNTPTWTPGHSARRAPECAEEHRRPELRSSAARGRSILKQLAANDPDVTRFGPARFNGRTPVASGGQANPLATRTRFLYPTRGEGQGSLPYVKTLNFKFGYRLNLGGKRHAQLGLNIFNALNSGRYTEWHRSGANLSYDPNFYLVQDNQRRRGRRSSTRYSVLI